MKSRQLLFSINCEIFFLFHNLILSFLFITLKAFRARHSHSMFRVENANSVRGSGIERDS